MPGWSLHDDLVRIAQVHDQLVALQSDTVANAVDFQSLLKALSHADNHVVQQAAGQAVQSAVLLQVVGAGHGNHIALNSNGHVSIKLLSEGALGALHGDDIVVSHIDLDAGGDGDGSSTNSAH